MTRSRLLFAASITPRRGRREHQTQWKGHEKLLVELTPDEIVELEWMLEREYLLSELPWVISANCYGMRLNKRWAKGPCVWSASYVVQIKNTFLFACQFHIDPVVNQGGRIVISV